MVFEAPGRSNVRVWQFSGCRVKPRRHHESGRAALLYPPFVSSLHDRAFLPMCHREGCARAGVLGRRGFALESVARICREAGGRHECVCARLADGRRLEVAVDPLFGGAQLGRP